MAAKFTTESTAGEAAHHNHIARLVERVTKLDIEELLKDVEKLVPLADEIGALMQDITQERAHEQQMAKADAVLRQEASRLHDELTAECAARKQQLGELLAQKEALHLELEESEKQFVCEGDVTKLKVLADEERKLERLKARYTTLTDATRERVAKKRELSKRLENLKRTRNEMIENCKRQIRILQAATRLRLIKGEGGSLEGYVVPLDGCLLKGSLLEVPARLAPSVRSTDCVWDAIGDALECSGL